MKRKWIYAYLDTAERFAKLSYADRLQVGAVVVKDHRIISIGYNGTPAGWDNNCEDIIEYLEGGGVIKKTKDEVIHAEANAIMKLSKSSDSGEGADLFCTHAPCVHCAKLIYGAGIKKVFYKSVYRDEDGINFLKKCNIDVEKVERNPEDFI
jgi:dCMP deaminase